jgi:tRNA modification GTPase
MGAGARETIFALASGAVRAGVGVVRVSGPGAGAAIRALSGRAPPDARRASLRTLRTGAGEALDEALVLWFPGPASFTGEDVAELHVHAGAAVLAALFEALAALPDTRPAEPGEFTRRAFDHGKLDLAEAEGLADLIDAETEGQRRQALRQMRGALSALYEGWRARLVSAMAMLEAAIDFPDEDLPEDLAVRVRPDLAALAAEIGAHAGDVRGERIRDGYRVVILGAPNAGKSSLLNALAGRDAAIVSHIPGTTRDVVEVRLTLGGYPVWIADTAGLREANWDPIEAEGIRRAMAQAAVADLRIGLVDARDVASAALTGLMQDDDVWAVSKIDLVGPKPEAMTALGISTVTGDGLDALVAMLTARVSAALGAEEAPVLTRARHRRLALAAQAAITRAMDALAAGPELAAEELRAAAVSVGRLTGRIDVEDLLDEVFARFCIGK